MSEERYEAMKTKTKARLARKKQHFTNRQRKKISRLCLWAFSFAPGTGNFAVYPMRGENLVFRDKAELDWFIEDLITQGRFWSGESELHLEEEGVDAYLDLSTNLGRDMLRRGLLFGKRKHHHPNTCIS